MGKVNWENKISNPAQLGGIETSILDNGEGRGTRIAWINTGTGLRYKVVLDRAMDIADAFYNHHCLAWLSHLGVRYPEPFSHTGVNWLKTFGGGLLTTCGLDHIGGPEEDQYGKRGLHGSISNCRAEIESIMQPDPVAGKMEMSITGVMRPSQVFGPSFELRRTISGKLGQPKIKIHDEVVNKGNTPAPHMILYHINLGWPLVDQGADILWKGDWQSPNPGIENKIFRKGNDFRKCRAPIDQHAGGGEEVVFIDPISDKDGQYSCGLHNDKLGIAMALRLQKDQLPSLTNWQHWGKGEYVTGLEPGTNPPIGQATARTQNKLIHLPVGGKKAYDLEIEILDKEVEILEFIKHFKE